MQIDKEFILTAPTVGYFAVALTGGTWVVSQNATPQNVAYKVALNNLSATDHSAKTCTIVGKDADGNFQTETFAMPAASVGVETTKYYSYVTTVTPSATIGTDTMNLTYADEAVSQTFVIDYNGGNASLGFVANGDVKYTGQYTLSSLQTSTAPVFITVSSNSSIYQKTATNAEAFVGKPTALRIKIDSFTGTQTNRIQITQ